MSCGAGRFARLGRRWRKSCTPCATRCPALRFTDMTRLYCFLENLMQRAGGKAFAAAQAAIPVVTVAANRGDLSHMVCLSQQRCFATRCEDNPR